MPLLIVLYAGEGPCCGGRSGSGGVVAGTGGGCCVGPLAVFAYVLSSVAQGSSQDGCFGGVAALFSVEEGGGNMSLLAEAVL